MYKFVFLFQGGGRDLFMRRAVRHVEGLGIKSVFFDTMDIDRDPLVLSDCISALKDADFIYMSIHGGLPYFQSFRKLDLSKPGFLHSEIEDELSELRQIGGLPAHLHDLLLTYNKAGGEDNCKSFLMAVLRDLFGADCTVPDVVYPQRHGLYAPFCGDGTKPVIGVLVHFHYVRHEDTAHIDALCEAIRDTGCEPMAVFSDMMPDTGFGGLSETIDTYFMGKIDALIVTTGHSLTVLSSPGIYAHSQTESVFEKLNVPVLQAMTTYYTYEQWKESLAGLDMMMLCGNVYQPEFDGQIISVTFSCSQVIMTPEGPRTLNKPIPDRCVKIAQLAAGWARLHRTPVRDKKAAIILHNMPPRADMIGCAYGLDTPASVYNMVTAMESEGFCTEFSFENGADIIGRITDGLTNDGRFLSSAEMLSRCERAVPDDYYAGWFSKLPEKVREEMERDWGIAPGEFMTADGQILVPGIHNGNLFIGLQPARAFEEKAEQMYHSTELTPPWQYIAFYRYLTDVFKADVVIHVGTHGTLEWLPGKEIGLSQSCYPEVALGTVPHIYPYIIDVPGEGAQAKRRSNAVIIDHLIPSMTESGLYGQLAALDDNISGYNEARVKNPQKLPDIAQMIWEKAEAQNVIRDIGLTREEFFADTASSIEKLHLWLSEIKASKIKNGLHIFGQVPQGQRYDDLVRLLDEYGSPVSEQKMPVHKIREKLDATTDELTNFLRGVRGEFVPQGPSGSPMRGCVHILPTGRNFYMIDPTAVPSRAAWETGKRLAEQMLEKHLCENGKMPESVTIVVYAGETITTGGDDIAEIMYLYGIEPVWFGETDRVIGLEVIPVSELKRPRIDVTLRISGLFRDTFPNLIERIEDAVNLVAALDESHEQNFVKKHIDEDIEQFITDGMSREQAFDMASLRVFGCPPGTYGAGVDIMINSKKWETQDDLGSAYINWSGHAYSRKLHGDKLTHVFKRRMGTTDVTIKNISSFEKDMLDDDDFYNYHGGLIAAVKSVRGEMPVSYSTDATEPKNVKTRTIAEDTARIMRARIANPKWAEGLKEHGYRGAQEFSAMVDIVFGWDAAASVIDDWMYDTIAENYLLNDEMREWIRSVNPWALHAISGRLLEACQRGMWDTGEEMLEELRAIYLASEGELEGL